MGRETKLLLGLLATLLGVFLGVLSMKLLVPRPPAGAGPDVHADVAASEPQDLVEPPSFPVPTETSQQAAASPEGLPAGSRFAAAEPSPTTSLQAQAAPRGPYVSPAGFAEPAFPSSAEPPVAVPPRAAGSRVEGAAASAVQPPPPGSTYVARAGDSWWSLAEQVYGDGRLYRAVFAWNRVINPSVSLVPGTGIELPPRDRLEAAWPALMPGP